MDFALDISQKNSFKNATHVNIDLRAQHLASRHGLQHDNCPPRHVSHGYGLVDLVVITLSLIGIGFPASMSSRKYGPASLGRLEADQSVSAWNPAIQLEHKTAQPWLAQRGVATPLHPRVAAFTARCRRL